MPNRTLLLAAAFVVLAALPVQARTLKQEPPMGGLKPGQRVLVDDGSCGAGKIKELIGGNHFRAGGQGTTERQRRCVSRGRR